VPYDSAITAMYLVGMRTPLVSAWRAVRAGVYWSSTSREHHGPCQRSMIRACTHGAKADRWPSLQGAAVCTPAARPRAGPPARGRAAAAWVAPYAAGSSVASDAATGMPMTPLKGRHPGRRARARLPVHWQLASCITATPHNAHDPRPLPRGARTVHCPTCGRAAAATRATWDRGGRRAAGSAINRRGAVQVVARCQSGY
jgi:hypothetical protein